MKVEQDIEKRIRAKRDEAQELQKKLSMAEAYIEALEESLRLIKRTSKTEDGDGIRLGSMIQKAQMVLRQEGKPLYVGDLLTRMGREATKMNRMSLSGSLGNYVRNGHVFTRPAPNTFGLIEFGESDDIAGEDPLPEGFGR